METTYQTWPGSASELDSVRVTVFADWSRRASRSFSSRRTTPGTPGIRWSPGWVTDFRAEAEIVTPLSYHQRGQHVASDRVDNMVKPGPGDMARTSDMLHKLHFVQNLT